MLDKVLKNLRVLIDNNVSKPPIKRVAIGTQAEAYMYMSQTAKPFVLIIPNGDPQNGKSFWANHTAETYSVKILIVFGRNKPNDARVESDSRDTLSDISAEIRQAIGTDKRLSNVVTKWSNQWSVADFTDDEGNQVREITTQWENDLIPFDGTMNNQTDLLPQEV